MGFLRVSLVLVPHYKSLRSPAYRTAQGEKQEVENIRSFGFPRKSKSNPFGKYCPKS